MPLRRQTQVIAQMDVMAGRTMGRAAPAYNRQTIAPLIAAIDSADSPEQFQGNLRTAANAMNTEALEEATAQVSIQAALIGRTTASAKIGDGERRSDEATEGRSDGGKKGRRGEGT